MTQGMKISTRNVQGRRTLRFNSLAEIQRDLDTLEAAHRAGKLRTLGNWTPGQNFNHLASFISYAYDGYPASLGDPPALLKMVFKLMKNKYLYKGMGAGANIPKVPGGTIGTEPLSFDDGIAKLRANLDRLEKDAPTVPNKLFGPMTHDQWRNMHQRHCELHLSFLAPS